MAPIKVAEPAEKGYNVLVGVRSGQTAVSEAEGTDGQAIGEERREDRGTQSKKKILCL